MKHRPLFDKSIADLEKDFEQNLHDSAFLTLLLQELEYRSTRRVDILKEKASGLLQTNGKKPGANTGTKIAEPQVQTPIVPRPPDHASPVQESREQEPQHFLPITNQPKDILRSWTALEVLSPQSFKKPEDLLSGKNAYLCKFQNGVLPWESSQKKSLGGCRPYYQIILGSVEMEPTISSLLSLYADRRIERPRAKGSAVLATIMVDQDGCLVQKNAFAISSFAWGVPVALSGELRTLGQWPDVENLLLKQLRKQVTLLDNEEEEKPIPLTLEDIDRAYHWLVEELALNPQHVKPPAFAIQTFQAAKKQELPEGILLNSFFLKDLGKASQLIEKGKTPRNLIRYLGIEKPENRKNLMSDKQALAETLEPRKFPRGSWPSKGRYPLALLQQSAVNIIATELKNGGLLAVNGPPGTGKTTLLRDVVADIVTERARVMAFYADPEQAFSYSGQKISKGQGFFSLFHVAKNLRGFEMVVASSNNKAVENVSAELPGIHSIADDGNRMRYFKTASDALLQCDTWGLIAAVLGNGKNRNAFRETFWWDANLGLHIYLKHASGSFPENRVGQEGLPAIIEKENSPKNKAEALQRWVAVKQRFNNLWAETEETLSDLQKACDFVKEIQVHERLIQNLNENLLKLKKENGEIESRMEQAQNFYRQCQIQYQSARDAEQDSRHSRPGFLSCLFRTAAYKVWREKNSRLVEASKAARLQVDEAEKRIAQFNFSLESLKIRIHELTGQIEKQEDLLVTDQKNYEKIALRYKDAVLINSAFFSQGHEKCQKTAPWLDSKTSRLRHELFEAAIAVHKAFVDCAAKPIRHNLGVFMEGFGAASLGNLERDALIPDLWATLFLLVPVVSTTFASVSRMFNKLDPEALGWLLIDEAGQALPQAAVGALMRTRKAIIVGDPIQIEPIVLLPKQLTEAICRQFSVDPLVYNAPCASAQTLADSATHYFGSFETQYGTREVGVPLLVHRRCSEPMFSISNAVAYEGLMVQAKAPQHSDIQAILGPSSWRHVTGAGQEKWCQKEGETVKGMLSMLKHHGCQPNLYIVTPFVIVQDNLRMLLRESGLLEGWVNNPREWIYERIGTVHTVQGREAEAVIFVLGAPNPEQAGARDWAGGYPNLLNVAITRAREALYVVGNQDFWGQAGCFQTLSKGLLHIRCDDHPAASLLI